MEEKYTSTFKIKCAACNTMWETPASWNERHTVPHYLHGECPKCGNWKHNVGHEVKCETEKAVD